MTEAEWLASEDPAAMLAYLSVGSPVRHRSASDRKLRLFAAACCRRVWPLLTDARSRAAVEVVERYADGLVTDDELAAAWAAAWAAARDSAWAASRDSARDAARAASRDSARAAAWDAARAAARAAEQKPQAATWDAARDAEQKTQAALLRDLIGNPFRPVTPPREWLTPDVMLLAGRAYEDRKRKCDDRICRGRGRWTDAAGDMDDCQRCAGTGTIDDGTLDLLALAALADALEEAGAPCDVCNGAATGIWDSPCRVCLSSKLLAHLRSPGPHYRGCWAVDLLLGKG